MSKKMLKRSLALGALMAFVITGSAYAGYDWKGNGVSLYLTGGETVIDSITIDNTGDNYFALRGYGDLNVKNSNNEAGNISITNVKSTIKVQNGTLKINANDIILKATGTNAMGISSDDSTGEKFIVNANNLTIDAPGEGIHGQGELLLSSDLKVNSGSHAVAVGSGGLTIKAENITLNATGANARGLYSEHGSLDVTAGSDVNITTGGNSVDGYGKLIVKDKLIITSAANAINARNTGLEIGANNITVLDAYDGVSGNVNVTANKMDIKADHIGVTGAGTLNITNKLTVESNGNAFTTAAGGLTVNANEIEINTTGNAFQVQNGNLNINDVNKLNIISCDRAICVASGAEANISVNELNISGAKESAKVSDNGTLNLIADSGIITNELYAASTGTINATLGAGVEWTGKFVTDDDATKGTLDLSGKWTLKDVAADTKEKNKVNSLTEATFREGSIFVIEGKACANNDGTNETYALNGVNGAKLTVENGAKLTVEGIDYNTYNIAKGFATVSEDKWDVTNLNTLMEGKWVEDEAKNLQLQVVAKAAEQIAEDLGVSETTGDFLSNLAEDAGASNVQEDNVTAKGKLVGLANAAANSQNDKVIAKAAAQAAEAVQKMAEAGGNSATAANVVTNVTGVTNQRLSLNNGNHSGNKGGHGVGLLEEGSGAAIWAQYVHGKDSVEDMPSEAGASSYEGQYNGIVMGVDFKKVGKFQSGIAFNYGEGDTNSVNTTSPTRSEYDFWGVGYYGNIRNADSNVIFDIGYAKTDSDVTSNVNVGTLKQTYEASPETTTWTAGVKVEKLYQNNNVQIVPYTGLRYMSIDPEDYTTKCGAMGYKMERQDIWLLPVGVSIKQEIVNPNGWVVTPKVDLSYIWTFGDTDSTMETNTVFGSDNRPIGYDVMDDGSWMGLVGVEAAMDDWTFGVSYSYQKGDHSESKKWYVDAKYSF